MMNNFLQILRPRIKSILYTVTILVILGVGLSVYYFSQFRVTGTDPTSDHFPTYARLVYIDFSQALSSAGFSVSSTPSVTSSSSVQGNQLVISLKPNLQDGKTYTITVHNITSISGSHIANYTLRFKVQYITYDQLSPKIQQSLSNHDQITPSRNTLVISGTDALVEQGVSVQQVDALKQTIFLFAKSIKNTSVESTITTPSIQSLPHDPRSDSSDFGLTFTITINKRAYDATLHYSGLTVARLILADVSTHATIYDSGDIDGSTLN